MVLPERVETNVDAELSVLPFNVETLKNCVLKDEADNDDTVAVLPVSVEIEREDTERVDILELFPVMVE